MGQFPAAEIAELIVEGQVYRNWKSVRVELDVSRPFQTFQFSTAEPIDIREIGELWRIQPHMECEVRLAGISVIKGVIVIREAVFNANEHGVMFFGKSFGTDATDSSVRWEGGQAIDGTFTSITNLALQGTGVGLDAKGDDGKTYPNFSIQVGETPWSVAERLARYQPGMRVWDNGFGVWHAYNLSQMLGPNMGEFIEGKNIIEARGTIDVSDAMNTIDAEGQQPTRDNVPTGSMTCRGTATDPTVRPTRYLRIPCEEPVTQAMVNGRALHELLFIKQGIINIEVKVYGWQSAPGVIFNVSPNQYRIFSPILDIDRVLPCKTVVFEQDDAGGSRTTLHLCTPESLGDKILLTGGGGGPWYGQAFTLDQVQSAVRGTSK